MDECKAPALLPALGVLAGAWLAPDLGRLPLAAVALLLALALAFGRPSGRLVAGLALGLLAAGVRGDPGAELARWLAPARPVEVVGRAAGHPSSHEDRRWVRFRTETLRQGTRVLALEVDVGLSLPADAEAPVLGSRWRVRGHLRPAATYLNHPALASRPAPWRMRVKSPRFAVAESSPAPPAAAGAALRARIEGRLDRTDARWRSPTLVRALVLGDASRLPEAWQQALRRSGLGHLLAISGLHVGLLTVAFVLLASPLPARGRLAVAAAAILLYLLLVGPRPSILRASAMGLLVAAALLWERPPQTWNALAAGVLVLVLWDPALARDLGFQLSVAATAGVLAVVSARGGSGLPGSGRPGSGLPGSGHPGRRRVLEALAISVAAQVATLPVLLPLTGSIHPGAPVLHLVALPWLAVFLVGALLWLALGAVSETLAGAVLAVLEAAATPLAGLASLPPSGLFLYGAGPGVAAAVALAAVLFAGLRRPRRAAAAGLAGLALWVSEAGPPRHPVEIAFFDVGQGDAILVRDGPRAVLVDGGGWPRGDLGGRVLVPALAAEGVRRLEALVSTHPDADHCGGLVDVARYLGASEVWMAPGWAEDPCARELVASPGPRWRPQWRGRRARVGRWRLEFLHPAAGPARGRNDRSLVIVAEVFGRRVLLTGDVESGAEGELVRRFGSRLRSDVLKLAHHGSRTSTTEGFLDAVRPAIAVVSAGARNPYGHPAPDVLRRLEVRRVRVLRTDLSGRVRLRFHPSGQIGVHLASAGRREVR